MDFNLSLRSILFHTDAARFKMLLVINRFSALAFEFRS